MPVDFLSIEYFLMNNFVFFDNKSTVRIKWVKTEFHWAASMGTLYSSYTAFISNICALNTNMTGKNVCCEKAYYFRFFGTAQEQVIKAYSCMLNIKFIVSFCSVILICCLAVNFLCKWKIWVHSHKFWWNLVKISQCCMKAKCLSGVPTGAPDPAGFNFPWMFFSQADSQTQWCKLSQRLSQLKALSPETDQIEL